MLDSEEYQKLYHKNNFESIAVNYLDAINKGKIAEEILSEPAHMGIASIVCLSLLKLEKFKEVSTLLSFFAKHKMHTAYFYALVCTNLVAEGKKDLIKKMLGNMPQNHFTYIFNLYAYGCCLHTERKFTEALEIFKVFKKIMPYFYEAASFLTHISCNVIFRQATLVATAAEVKRRFDANQQQRSITNLKFIERHIASDKIHDSPIFMSSADSDYFELFIPNLIESISQHYQYPQFHINIINASENALKRARQLIHDYPKYAIDISIIDDKYAHRVSYSCVRFYALETLLSHYQQKIICLDADLIFETEAKSTIANLPDCDFACFNTGDAGPALLYACGLMLFAPTEPAMNFLRHLLAFCEEKIHLPAPIAWMLDQAALYSVSHYFRIENIPFEFFEITEPFYNSFSLIPQSQQDEKKHLRAEKIFSHLGTGNINIYDFNEYLNGKAVD